MRILILGIGGTFMGGVALLARELGHEVSGCDANVYPPMSTQLAAQGIRLHEGYDPAVLDEPTDIVIVGNALTRGNPVVERVLERGMRYTSGAQWVADEVLPGRLTMAVAGTHGKTTTTSILAWMLESAGLAPGFLVGGVPENFGVSARLGKGAPFVIEADEYDTAFFDKRSKFVHYRPRVAILNNLEFDHADIFPDLDAIERQFHHLVRTVPAGGRLIVNAREEALRRVLEAGCWTPRELFAEAGEKTADWQAEPRNADVSQFRVHHRGAVVANVEWELIGRHNMLNALAAMAAANAAGVAPERAAAALTRFRNVKRRLEIRGTVNGVTIYDDFAHHPTAVATTLAALRARVGKARIVAVIELRSNTMRAGVHRETLGPSLALADRVHVLRPAESSWDIQPMTRALGGRGRLHATVDDILTSLERETKDGDHVLIMSNGGFGGIHGRLLDTLKSRPRQAPAREGS